MFSMKKFGVAVAILSLIANAAAACDMVVVTPKGSADGSMIWAKNSNRNNEECMTVTTPTANASHKLPPVAFLTILKSSRTEIRNRSPLRIFMAMMLSGNTCMNTDMNIGYPGGK